MTATNGREDSGSCREAMLRVMAAILAMLMFCMLCVVAGGLSCLRGINRCCGCKLKKLDPIFYEDWFTFNVNSSTLRVTYRDVYSDLSCRLKVGVKAPNIQLNTLEGVKKTVFDFQKPNRPLVINFGSCS